MSEQIRPGGDVPQGRATWFAERYEQLVQSVASFIQGKDDVIRMCLVCLLAEGHLLLEEVPGTGKTSLAKAIAASIDGSMRRVQFTPDLLPSDVTGVQVYDPGKREFEFHPGPVFANIVLGDEINRASPKTQSALLEVMAEGQVTIDSVAFLVPRPFIVLATQNPIEHGGTYDLPEAQLDRFMMRTSLGYPDFDAEVRIVAGATSGRSTDDIRPVMTAEQFGEMIDVVGQVHLAPAVAGYIVTITSATRTMAGVRLGVSPRGSASLARAAKAYAASRGRAFVTADDVKAVVEYVLPHRILLLPEAELQGKTSHALLHQVMTSVPVPQQRVEA